MFFQVKIILKKTSKNKNKNTLKHTHKRNQLYLYYCPLSFFFFFGQYISSQLEWEEASKNSIHKFVPFFFFSPLKFVLFGKRED